MHRGVHRETHTRSLCLLAGLVLISMTTACQTTQPHSELVGNSEQMNDSDLVWSDEFEGAALDTEIWEIMQGNGRNGWGNHELQYYTGRPENVTVSDGMLTITARAEQWEGHQYTSARLRTKDKADFRYGRMEARLKAPRGQGIWPAFWMMPTESVYGGWPRSGEIDIFESINDDNTVHGTLHFGHPKSKAGGKLDPDVDISETFNVYAIEWEPHEIRWYFNGQQYASVPSSHWYTSRSKEPSAPFDQEFHFLLNVAVGGRWPGDPDKRTTFPQTLVVDWVRVYRLPQSDTAHSISAED